MNYGEIVDLSSDDEAAVLDVKTVKLEPESGVGTMQQRYYHNARLAAHEKCKSQPERRQVEKNKSANALSNSQSSASILEEGQSPTDDVGITSSSIGPAPIYRQFWKAGNYNDTLRSKVTLQNGKSCLHVHPMFLHSNATSHKWAFGAFAELLDNAIDEIQNGATYVIVDKTTNPRDGNPALLIQDNGGGMDPVAMRRCMSFGFSDKKSKSTIGQYGNGFKTSSMRLGADVIVFSRHLGERTATQSIGLLSYTFLTKTGHDRIVVPMVDYELNASTGSINILHGREHFTSNLSKLLQWSPYSTEEGLLKQFDDIDSHGTKIIVYNLWFTDDGIMELDFDSDPEDIRISGDIRKVNSGLPGWRSTNEQHIANRLHYSLRAYASILYMRIPENFCIILRGQVIQHHNIATELKFPEFVVYRPQSGEGSVLTTIGFLKEAPHVNIHGFNVYHKNRLILPFWHVVSYQSNRGRGVVGVLEANFIQPTHNKQDFERTPLFQKLEARLKEMTWEYWDYHCGLLGYHVSRKPKAAISQQVLPSSKPDNRVFHPIVIDKNSPAVGIALPSIANYQVSTAQGSRKRKDHSNLSESAAKKNTGEETNISNAGHELETQPCIFPANQPSNQERVNLMHENKKLRAKCSEYEKSGQELNHKVTKLRSELEAYRKEYNRLLAELQSFDPMKEEKNV